MSGGMGGGDGGGAAPSGGGFHQSTNAFTGLTNTDLRPRRRKRRPVPLLETYWLRRKGQTMRKDVAGHVDTLRSSVIEIANSPVENREELLTKSLNEFHATLEDTLDDLYGVEDEPLEKGLNHVSAFASALNRMNQVVTAIKTGRPNYMIDSDSNSTPEPVPAGIELGLDHFMRCGLFVLRSMVNDTGEFPDGDEELERAEEAGMLAKIETPDIGDIPILTMLPDDLRVYFTDPLELMLESADLGQELTKRAIDLADLVIGSQREIPEDIIEAYPEIFGVEDEELGKAGGAPFPPKRKPQAGDTGQGGDDENAGDGGDPNAASDPTDQGAQGDQGDGGDAGDMTDDTPQNPIEMIARLASIITVISGSLMQGAQGADQGAAGGGATGGMAMGSEDQRNVGLQRGEPISEVPLAKILAGEVEVDDTVADAIEELMKRREETPALTKQLTDANDALAQLRKTVAELQARPAPAKGVMKVVPVTKQEDGQTGSTAQETAAEIDRLSKANPDGAVRLLIKQAHSTGGRPLVPVL